MTDSFENRILLHLKDFDNHRTTWNELKYSLEKEMGSSINPNLLHFKLKKLRDEGKVKFISIGDFTSYSLMPSS